MAELGVPLTGLMAVVGGLFVALGPWGRPGRAPDRRVPAAHTPLMHAFWRETEAMQQQLQMVDFMKNTGLLGGALALFYAWNQLPGEAGLSITDPLFGRW
jgi:putative oxidoreductase